MRIKFLGSGSAFVLAEENYQSNILISKDDKHLLYDAGETVSEALNHYGMIPQDLDSIFISHLHGDHSGGIESIAFKTYFQVFNFGKTEFGSMRPKLFGHHSILRDGWDTSWKGGLQSIQGETNTLESYFKTFYMKDNDHFSFQGTEMRPIQTVHVVDNRRIVPSYGLMFNEDDTTVFITGDTQFAPNQMLTYYAQADLIFQDCEFAEYPNSVHAQFHQLQNLDKGTKAKMWLYHYSLGQKTYEELEQEALDAGFAGLVKKGQEFFTGDVN